MSTEPQTLTINREVKIIGPDEFGNYQVWSYGIDDDGIHRAVVRVPLDGILVAIQDVLKDETGAGPVDYWEEFA
jgi:hypothetical protein